MTIITYIVLSAILIYALIILAFVYGWVRIKKFKPYNIEQFPHVSIVVACRNEEGNIKQLLESLSEQCYPKEKTEIILVDDHSEDQTVKIIRNFQGLNIRLLILPEDLSGKKDALRFGINSSTSEISITTDADCTMGKNWLTSMVSYYSEYKPKLIVAPVVLYPLKNLFQKLQSLEFMSLIGSGAGAIGIHRPIMCNGANLLFEKSIYENALFENKYASGDDIFLLLSAKKQHRQEIHFLKSTDAIVFTKPAQTLMEFFRQRIRWTSKSKAYRDFDIIFIALLIALSNLMLAFTLIASAFNPEFISVFLSGIFIKSIADIALLVPVTRFLKYPQLMWWFAPLQILYPFYIVFTAIAGIFGKFTWKNRSLR